MFHRAAWHISSAAVALAASKSSSVASDTSASKKICCHPPDSRTQRGWLAAFNEMSSKSAVHAEHEDCFELVKVYLSSMSNSGTVDRFLGQVKLAKLRRGHVQAEGLQSALQLLVQDLGGRRREPLDPVALLVEPVPRTSAAGLVVAQPATRYAQHCQALYGAWYGKRKLPGRSIDPASQSAQKLEESRLRSTKPRLAPLKQRSGKSEGDLIQKHAKALQKACKVVSKGGGAEKDGPLGPITMPKNASTAADIVSDQAAACMEIAQARSKATFRETDQRAIKKVPSCSS